MKLENESFRSKNKLLSAKFEPKTKEMAEIERQKLAKEIHESYRKYRT